MASGKVPTIDPGGASLSTTAPKAQQDPNVASTGGKLFFNLGKGMEEISAQLEAAHTLAETTKAENILALKTADIKNRAANDTDTSAEGLKKYHAELEQAATEAGQSISLPYAKEIFKSKADAQAGIDKFDISNTFRKRVIDQGKADLETNLNKQQQNYVNSDNPVIKQKALMDMEAKIKEMAKAGYISQEEGIKRIERIQNEIGAEDVAHQLSMSQNPDQVEAIRNALLSGAFEQNGVKIDDQKKLNLLSTIDQYKKKTETEYTRKVAEQNNAVEAGIAGKIANNQYTISDLERDKPTLSEGFYQAAAFSLSQAGGDIGTEDQKSIVFSSFIQDFSKIQSMPTDEKPKAMIDFRNKVLTEKKKLDPEAYSKLLSWTDPNFIKQQIEPKQTWLQTGFDFIKQHIASISAIPPVQIAGLYKEFFSKATQPSVQPQGVLGVAKEIVRTDAYKNNPELVGKDDLANKTMTAESHGFKHVYSGQTNLKHDFTIKPEAVPEGMVKATSPTGKAGYIPKDQAEKAKKKGYAISG